MICIGETRYVNPWIIWCEECIVYLQTTCFNKQGISVDQGNIPTVTPMSYLIRSFCEVILLFSSKYTSGSSLKSIEQTPICIKFRFPN
jgi:hypothetical protein